MIPIKKPIFIAEIKTQSPFGFKSSKSFHELMELAIENGDWISVHTNVLWGGDYEAISFVRKYTDKPILAKGIHSTNENIDLALKHGADCVLVVDRIPHMGYRQDCLMELNNTSMHNSWEYSHILRLKNPEVSKVIEKTASVTWNKFLKENKFVCNSRNLATGNFELDPKPRLDDFIKKCGWVCQASGIRCPRDIHPNVDAFIVGEGLVNFCLSIKK